MRFVPQGNHDQYKSTLMLLFNMADASVRLALMHSPREGAEILEQFKGIVRAQASYFLLGRFPDQVTNPVHRAHVPQ
ncbi:hypothetical protein J2T09_005540 [Neorhizobium huautlense]|uniref:Tetracyclin repressor SCO1712-like C-terminal domain-containing protein n=1 Tax=Neorhizobium huautlense TaxID=67774 RepID=A0ABT9Q205_9HYPH|nr:hypothetical protein [Neorhizobium huautlense]